MIADALAALMPPADWGRDPTVPYLVRRYLQLRDEVYSMVERAAPDAEAYDRCERTADDVTMVIVTMLSRR